MSIALAGMVGQRFDGGGIFGGSHSCNLFKLPRKIVDGRKTDRIRNLGEVVLVFPDHLFGQIYFHP